METGSHQYPKISQLDKVRYKVGDFLSLLKNQRPNLEGFAINKVRNAIQSLLDKKHLDPVDFLDHGSEVLVHCKNYWRRVNQLTLMGYAHQARNSLKSILSDINEEDTSISLEELKTAIQSLCDTFSRFLEQFPEASENDFTPTQSEADSEAPVSGEPGLSNTLSLLPIPTTPTPLGTWHKPTPRRVRGAQKRRKRKDEIYRG